MIKTHEQFHEFHDPGMCGLSPRGIAWGTFAMMGLAGFVIPQDEGIEKIAGVAVFSGELDGAIDYACPVGIALGKPAAVKTFAGRTFKPDTWYHCDVRPFNAAGVIGDGQGWPINLRTDGGGALIDPPVPNPPTFVSARPIAGGKVRVSVGYSRWGQSALPVDLEVYGKQVSDPGTPDTSGLWDIGNRQTDQLTGLTAIPASSSTARYLFETAAKTDGQWWIFGAVFRNATAGRGFNEVVSAPVRISAVGAEDIAEFLVS